LITAHSLLQDCCSAEQECASWSSLPGQVAGKIQHTPWFTVGMTAQPSSALYAQTPPFAVQAVSSIELQPSVLSAALEHSPELFEFWRFECSRHESW
jgi:hypothetical protein